MKILLTGATGYIGQHLLMKLLGEGLTVYCCVRDPSRFNIPKDFGKQVKVIKYDFVNPDPLCELPLDLDVAYYLIHSMSASVSSFENLEEIAARNFRGLVKSTNIKQIIYLSGICNDQTLSQHLQSRLRVENELRAGQIPVTVLRAGIIVGAGSASFELIRDIVEKLPVMIAPKWLQTRCQPISIENVLDFLSAVKLNQRYYDASYDIGGPDILTYKAMLLEFSKVRGLGRKILSVPLMTPRLSSYWLYFVTSVSYPLAVNLVNSMKVEVICRPNNLAKELGISLIPYRASIQKALRVYGRDEIIASWKDALSSSYQGSELEDFQEVPKYGCMQDRRVIDLEDKRERVLENIWAIGGERGWYYGNWLWRLRGIIDKFFGGVGLRRGRTHANKLEPGDALDFWRVLDASKERKRLLLLAEMKLHGEAWLEFQIIKENGKHLLYQTATFRLKGLLGRMYWYAVLPLHYFVFNGMIRRIKAYQ